MKESNVSLCESQSLSIVKAVSVTATEDRRKKIQSLEAAMLQEEQVDIPVNHMFSGGVYAREITIPKGTLLTGRIHKFDHFDIMLSGDVTVSTDSGEVKRLTGLNIMEGKAGKKRAGYTHEDTHWITFHSAEEREPEQMYDFLTCGSFEELEDFNLMLDRADYKSMVLDMGATEDQIRKVVENKLDMTELDDSFSFLSVRDSEIQGAGLFSEKAFSGGDIICPSRIGDKRTIAGRYSNHSFSPNCKMRVMDGYVDLVAINDIPANTELTVNYRNVISERKLKGDL